MLSPRKITARPTGRPDGRLSERELEAASPPAPIGCAAHGTGPPLRPQDCFAPRTRGGLRPVLTPEPLRPLRTGCAGSQGPARKARNACRRLATVDT